jgi:hypothetical protein
VVDFDRITVSDLIKRFQIGQSRVYCGVEGRDDKYLFFKRVDVLLHAVDCFKKEHLVKRELRSAEDFINYTKQYYAQWEER